jgi:deazaflavin-dependent oxidoreductase (nitroreductase family)
MGKAPLLLLHHVGRRSGKRRVTPLIYVDDGGRLALVASAGGAAGHPAWFVNLRARPETEVEVRGERRAVRAREAEGDERERLWRRAVELYPNYAVYARRTGRRIPVVVLEPRP